MNRNTNNVNNLESNTREQDNKQGERKKKDNKRYPICLWEPHKSQAVLHYLRDCSDCPADEKNRLLTKRAESLKTDGRPRSTRSQTQSDTTTYTTGRLQSRKDDLSGSPSCPISVTDGLMSLNAVGRWDDGSDDSIASPNFVQRPVLKVICRFNVITPVQIQIA